MDLAGGVTLSDAEIRVQLLANGYLPVELYRYSANVKGAGKRPMGKAWEQRARAATPETVQSWSKGNTGIMCDQLVGVDIDVLDPTVTDQLAAVARQMLGAGALERVGKAPKVLLLYRAAEPGPKMETKEYLLPDGSKAQVELLGHGQQFVGFGIHPDTEQPYAWSGPSPLDVPLDDLPAITREAMTAFLKQATTVLVEAGAALLNPEKPKPEPATVADRQSAVAQHGAGGASFFKQVNRAALDALDRWVPRLFPSAEFQPGTGAWRVDSATLNRGDEEDLSIHPSGIRDFGPGRRLSPCDLVMQHGGAATIQAAAFALCDWIGRAPAELGWKEPRKRQDRTTGAPGTPGNDDVLLTEHGVAVAFVKRFQDRLRYCHSTGGWFEWRGTHWQRDQKHAAFSFARNVVAEANKDYEMKVQAITGKASFAGGVEKFAQRDPALAVTSEDWDRDLYLLATPGGVVDLRTGELRSALPSDMMTRITAIGPAPLGTDCPAWRRFLLDATNGDVELIGHLKRWCGYCLTGDTKEHALLFGHGPGGNGKSVFLNTVANIMGAYATTAAMDTFTASLGDKHPTDLAMLRGARLVVASETEEGRAWAEARIKQMTGGDPITARFMRQDFFTFQPQFKLTIIGNHAPRLKNVDEAMRRRFNIVPFIHKPANPDRDLERKLRDEWPAILAWMIDGCLAWQTDGLPRPQVVIDATAEYFEAQDSFGQWLKECCDLHPVPSTQPSVLLASFAEWCRRNGEDQPNRTDFKALVKRTPGLKYGATNGKELVRGIRLKADREEQEGGRWGK